MMKRTSRFLALALAITVTQNGFAFQSETDQEDTVQAPSDWFLRDPQDDHVQGLSVEKTYNTLLKGRPSKTVLVAVIDSGIDAEHEDLKDVMWVNEDEIAGNGIDDDKNGYIDDVHGWNFIGGKDGNVDEDTYEVTREYARLKPKYEKIDEKKISKKDKAEYEYWKKVRDKYDRDFEFNKTQFDQYQQLLAQYQGIHVAISEFDSIFSAKLGTPLRKSNLTGLSIGDDRLNNIKMSLIQIMGNIEEDITVHELLEALSADLKQLASGVDHYRTAVEFGYNLEFNSRTVVGDHPTNLAEKNYGNNDVEGPDAKHGTHVAGIIAANRNNNLGVKGIADNVRIMSVRAVPNGDERDKDVANAILYAANNGAKIINMSFGKSFSPNKDVVDKAVKYAESKGVLFVHAAGNDSDDLDLESNFPNRMYKKGGEAKNWLEIGASSWGADKNFVGSFSNYGKKAVDLFSPGVEIYSTVPNNEYEDLQGTSMASPATAGVAAVLLSYFPDLTAAEVKDILRQSTRKFDGLKVTKPGTQEEIPFSDLSSTGGLVNAYEAVKLALSMKSKPLEK